MDERVSRKAISLIPKCGGPASPKFWDSLYACIQYVKEQGHSMVKQQPNFTRWSL